MPEELSSEFLVNPCRFGEHDCRNEGEEYKGEEDERQEARRLRDLRGRVKAARAVVSTMPGLAEALQSDWQ